MEEPAKPTSRRQIARLIGGSTLPMYVLSEDDIVVFANQAAGRHFHQDADHLVGIDCSVAGTANTSADSLAMRMGAPTQWDRQHVVMTLENNGEFARLYIPLEPKGTGTASTIFVVICPESAESAKRRFDPIGLRLRDHLAQLKSMADSQTAWYLAGSSPQAKFMRRQVQLASKGIFPVTVLGTEGEPREQIASLIHRNRRDKKGAKGIGSLITIDCKLMDGSLLANMFELIEESRVALGKELAVLLKGLDRLPLDLFQALEKFVFSHSELELMATAESLPSRHEDSPLTRVWLRVSSFVVPVPRISERKEDLRELLDAWFHKRQQAKQLELRDESKQVDNHFVAAVSFFDAMAAHPWNGDLAEFEAAMTHAFDSAKGLELHANHLPIAVRTSISQLEESQKVTPLDLDLILENTERTLIMEALECSKGNRSAAAKLLNISRARLLRRLQQWGIETNTNESPDDDVPKFEEIE